MGQQTGYGLAGALLSDLVAAGRLGVSDDGKKLRVLDAGPTGDDLLDEGLRRFGDKDGKRLSSVIPGAARKLGRAVSVISYAIAQLEAQLDVRLFAREGSRRPCPSQRPCCLPRLYRSVAQTGFFRRL